MKKSELKQLIKETIQGDQSIPTINNSEELSNCNVGDKVKYKNKIITLTKFGSGFENGNGSFTKLWVKDEEGKTYYIPYPEKKNINENKTPTFMEDLDRMILLAQQIIDSHEK